MVPCITWVKRGAAKRAPEKVALNAEDLKRLIHSHGSELERLHLNDDSDEGEETEEQVPSTSEAGVKRKRGTVEDSEEKQKDEEAKEDDDSGSEEEDDTVDIAEKYGLDDYEDDEDENTLAMDHISAFGTNRDDPYIGNDDDNSDAEELEILPDDSLVVVTKVHGDYNTLEVHVYEEEMSNLYCHHDLLLPSFPLAIEWLDFDPGESSSGNFVALGTMEPDIEIWDMDVLDCMEPAFVLAGTSKKKGKKKKKTSAGGHTDAVLGLSWNRNQRQVLASASADFTIGIWDLQEGKMVSSIPHHEEKVQDIQWHPLESQSLLSGSFDKTARVFDCRSPDEAHKSWRLSGEVETVTWNHHNPYFFLASTDDGHISYMDVRMNEPVMTWEAHEGATTGVCVDQSVPGCLVTVSADKSLKIWDIRKDEPKMILKKNLNMGQLHCIASCPDSALLYAVGGETEHRVLNLKKNEAVRGGFGLSTQTSQTDAAGDQEEFPVNEDEDEESEKEAASAVQHQKKKKKKKRQQ